MVQHRNRRYTCSLHDQHGVCATFLLWCQTEQAATEVMAQALAYSEPSPDMPLEACTVERVLDDLGVWVSRKGQHIWVTQMCRPEAVASTSEVSIQETLAIVSIAA